MNDDRDMANHDLNAVTETNRRAFIAVCNCGWISNVHTGPPDEAERAARESHAAHQRAQRRASA